MPQVRSRVSLPGERLLNAGSLPVTAALSRAREAPEGDIVQMLLAGTFGSVGMPTGPLPENDETGDYKSRDARRSDRAA